MVIEMELCMLKDTGMDKLQGESIHTIIYILNHYPTKVI